MKNCIGIRYLWIVVLGFVACRETKKQEDRLPYYHTASFHPQWLSKEAADTIHRIPSFQLKDQSGKLVTEATVEGKIYVADFFFTSCPGICKRLTNHLKLVQDAFAGDADVHLLSYSVTPETDSVPRLKSYAQQYGIDGRYWHLLTGDRKQIYTLARKGYFADEDMDLPQNENDFLHTENLLLIDKQGHIRGVYKGTSATDIQNLIADIRKLKMES